MTGTATHIWQRIRSRTLVEWLVVFAIIAVVIALLLPGPRWGASGQIVVPVHVTVFDPISGKPIPQAQVAVLRHWGGFGNKPIEGWEVNLEHAPKSPTNEQGSVMINHEFVTDATDRRPIPVAVLRGGWVFVQAPGYNSVFVPIRNESIPTAELRKRGELTVPIAMLPAK